ARIPVILPRSRNMSLTPQQVEHYQREGYVIVDHFFDAREVAAMRAELERFKREGKIANVATTGDGKTISSQTLNYQIIPLNNISDLYRALPFAPKMVEAVRQCLGGTFARHLDQIFLKPGGNGAGTKWHQDNGYFQIPGATKGVGVWTALHDATKANGTM